MDGIRPAACYGISELLPITLASSTRDSVVSQTDLQMISRHDDSSELVAGVIDPGRLYSLETFQKVSGLKRAALAAARQNGLVVLRANGRGWILGQDFIRYLQNQNAERSAKPRNQVATSNGASRTH